MSGHLEIPTAEVYAPLLSPARYKGAYGGRGSGKSHFFAENLCDLGLSWPGDAGEGLRVICGREVQKSLQHSAKPLIEKKLQALGLGEQQGFKVYKDVIKTPKDGVIVFQGLQDHTTESVKSFEGFHIFWGEESQSLSKRSVNLVRPTIRWENKTNGMASELWFSWNPTRKHDAVDILLRGGLLPTGAIVVKANWRDNPWFPAVLEQERLDDLNNRPEIYDHVWEGGYVTAQDGAYFAKQLAIARQENRIGKVPRDPLMATYAFFDIGGTGAKADACAIWIIQIVGKEIRVIDYYEAVGQELSDHVAWLRAGGYEKANVYLPHDGVKKDSVYRVSYESELRKAGFHVEVVPNAGTGAAMQRVEAIRRVFPNVWIDEKNCSAGLDALGWYHEKKDETRDVGLGPEHDWSSHGSDSFGLMALVYEKLGKARRKTGKPQTSGSWMSM